MNKETAKTKAKALRAFLAARGIDLNHSGALEAIAAVEGQPNYNVMQARFQSRVRPQGEAESFPPADFNLDIFEVDVTRTGYANRLITVTAKSEAEAAERAVDKARGLTFSEHSSYYALAANVEPEDDGLLAFDKNALSVEVTWEVEVSAVSYGTETLSVSASNQEIANEIALDIAGNYSFDSRSWNYVVLSVCNMPS